MAGGRDDVQVSDMAVLQRAGVFSWPSLQRSRRTAAIFSIGLGLGGLGHEAICELAFRELDNTARQRVT